MSYSNYGKSNHGNAATAYREREVLTASPAKLVVLVYDHILANLRRAQVAHEVGNVEARIDAVASARAGLMELLITLDMEKGGEIASQLRSLYSFVLTELTGVPSATGGSQRYGRLITIVNNLRDAFAAIATDSSVVSAA